MKKIKIIMVILVIISSILLIANYSNAATDEYVTTTVINGVTANWEYRLNDSNQIVDLKCTNPSDLKGSVTIPTTLDGKTVTSLGDRAFKSATNITEIIIPDSVKEIESYAFENCAKLTKVDLGSIESIDYHIFSGCTSLTTITIPKTLKDTSSGGAPCLDNPNITNIIFEEGLTVIPSALCANTGITSVTIPNSVKKIELWAFEDCTKLDKITILDNVTDMSYYSDSIFENHNDNLTIYCYKDSVAANHAIKNNIKYVYLTKEENKENTENDKEKEEYEDKVTDNKSDKEEKDTTTAQGILPNTGIGFGLVVTIISLVGLGVFTYSKYNNLKDVK